MADWGHACANVREALVAWGIGKAKSYLAQVERRERLESGARGVRVGCRVSPVGPCRDRSAGRRSCVSAHECARGRVPAAAAMKCDLSRLKPRRFLPRRSRGPDPGPSCRVCLEAPCVAPREEISVSAGRCSLPEALRQIRFRGPSSEVRVPCWLVAGGGPPFQGPRASLSLLPLRSQRQRVGPLPPLPPPSSSVTALGPPGSARILSLF